MVKGITLSVTASIIIITGCGGGGGGGVGNIPTNVSYISHEEEYQAQYGLNKINTANANLGGSTGENIRIAVIDTGIDANHQEFNQGTILGATSQAAAVVMLPMFRAMAHMSQQLLVLRKTISACAVWPIPHNFIHTAQPLMVVTYLHLIAMRVEQRYTNSTSLTTSRSLTIVGVQHLIF